MNEQENVERVADLVAEGHPVREAIAQTEGVIMQAVMVLYKLHKDNGLDFSIDALLHGIGHHFHEHKQDA